MYKRQVKEALEQVYYPQIEELIAQLRACLLYTSLFAFLVGVDGQCGGEYAQSFYLHRASHSQFVGQGFAQLADNS